jgi:hypothetical protein
MSRWKMEERYFRSNSMQERIGDFEVCMELLRRPLSGMASGLDI